MGIKGFSHYIHQRSKKFLSNHLLHNTYSVIDGNSLMFHIFNSKKCSYQFGGDYAEFAFYLSEFFDQLLACNVHPLIIIDGGMEDKKINTQISRAKKRFASMASSNPTRALVIPLMTKEVFKQVAQSKNIPCVQSTFEADNCIASIARILKCPVLSSDSDFFFIWH